VLFFNSFIKNLLTGKKVFLLSASLMAFQWIQAQTNDSIKISVPDTISLENDSQNLNPDTTALKTDSLSKDSLNVGVSDELKSKVHYTSDDSIVFDVEEERVYLYKNGKVDYEDLNLKADYIRVNWNDKTVLSAGMIDSAGKYSGRPVFKQGGDEFVSDTMRYNMDTKKGRITNVRTQQGDGFIHGETVKKVETYSFIRNGFYTTCDLDTPHYYIAANKLKVIPNNKIVTGPAYLVIEGIPTPLAIPFGMFPNTKGRSSGIIIPAYGESAARGFFLTNGGYYFGISDKIDAEINADVYSLGGWAGRLFTQYKNRYHYTGNFKFSYETIEQGEPELSTFSKTKSFFVNWSHAQDPKARPNSNFSASVQAGSTNYYKNALTPGQNYLTNSFGSSVSFTKSFPGKPFNFSASLNHSQNTKTHIVSLTAPNIVFSVNTLYPFARKEPEGTPKWYEKINISYTTKFQNQLSIPDSMLFKTGTINRFQNGMQHSIPISTSLKMFKYFTLTPSVSYNEWWYLQTVRKTYDGTNQVTDTVPHFATARDYNASLSLNTKVFGMVQFRNSKLVAIRHVLTPTISFSYRPDFGQDKYGYSRYVFTDLKGSKTKYSIFERGIYGGPSFGKYGFVGLGLDNNLEMKMKQVTDTAVNFKKIKIFESLSISSGYNLAVDSFNWSPVSVAARTTILEKMNISANASFDPYVVDKNHAHINVTEWKQNHQIARFTNAAVSTGFSFSQQKKTKTSTKGSEEQLNDINKNPDAYVDFTIPFTIRVDYSLQYDVRDPNSKLFTQALNFSGDISLTEHWKITYASGYDFRQKDFSYTNLGIYRDLHCWEMHINWIPFGPSQQYFFQINVKSSLLQDLKLIKRNDPYDSGRF
jgi:hypothetical protein